MKYRFTNRTGGNSSGSFSSFNLGAHVLDNLDTVLSNRKALSEEFGEVQFMNQVHGSRVAIIESQLAQDPTVDALVTGIVGIALAVQVADCIPLLLTSKEAVAAVHVGRKGLMNGVTIKVLKVMREMGAQRISAIIGPSICGRCYEVSQEIYDEVVSIHPSAASTTPAGRPALELSAGLRTLLESQSIRVADESRCTVENFDLFSYRRDGITGRQVGIISL